MNLCLLQIFCKHQSDLVEESMLSAATSELQFMFAKTKYTSTVHITVQSSSSNWSWTHKSNISKSENNQSAVEEICANMQQSATINYIRESLYLC